MNITERIREAIETDGRSRYRLAKETGIDAAALHRFFYGERKLNSDTIDRLADVLGLELQPKRPTKKARKKGKR